MYNSSSQLRHWKFENEEAIKKARVRVNRDFVNRNAPARKTEEEKSDFYLTPEEEYTFFHFYEFQLREFCIKFQPYMHKALIATSMHYFKRFYLQNSVMDFHPRDIMVTCAFLACKTEEFYVPLPQFASNYRAPIEKTIEIILNLEMIVLNAMKFHLTIHNPYRPVEGYFIDIKTRFPKFNIELLRPYIDEFLDKCLYTDVPLMFSPSQIALASIFHGASKCKENLDKYVTDILVSDQDMLGDIIDAVKTIRQMIRSASYEWPSRDVIKPLDRKLELCRNPENNPETEIYKERLMRELQEEDDGMGEKIPPPYHSHVEA